MTRPIFVKNLDDAYSQGYFSGSINRYEFLEKVQKKNKQLRYIYGKDSIGLYDTDKAKYVSPIGNTNPIPKFTLYQEGSNKVLCKSYKAIIKSLRRQGYEID